MSFLTSIFLSFFIRYDFGLTPPVLVAHSLSSFIGQKYLESYSLKGLVLVNPIPPAHTEVVQNLLIRHKNCEINFKENLFSSEDKNKFTQAYYNLESEVQDSTPFPKLFMENILADKNAFLRLEKGKYTCHKK